MGQTYRLLTGAGVGVSAIVYPQRGKDEAGIFQWRQAGGTVTEIRVEGRADENAPWFSLFARTQANLVGGTDAVATVMWPQMRIDVISTDGAISAWLDE